MLNIRLAGLALLLALATSAMAQYSYTGKPVAAEPDSLAKDSLSIDTTAAKPVAPAVPAVREPSESDRTFAMKRDALTWVRRLIYRGFLDDQTTGTSATYALTEWSETSGPFGPVLAHVTIAYLGSVSWLGKPSAWFQATYKSFDEGRPSVDFDIVLAANDGLGEVYRALWRANKDPLEACGFVLPPGQLDYEREDKPRPGDETVLKLFSGEFPVTKYNGSGADGAKVIAYRGSDVPPLGIVRLGYGGYSLNLRDRANDVEPKLQVPLPTSR